MKGILLVNAYYRAEEYLYQARRMREELAARGVAVDVVRNDGFAMQIRGEDYVNPYTNYDFCIYWDKDKYVLDMLDRKGMRLFNPAEAIRLCDDKMSTYIALAGHGIPMPHTLPGLLCFRPEEPLRVETVDAVERALGYPLVAKYCYGSLGAGVYRVDDREALIRRMREMQCAPHLFQQYVGTESGRDVRVIVVGGEVLGGMLRRSDGDFCANIGAGGHGQPFALDEDWRQLAVKVARTLRLDYCGIDFLFGAEGPVVCEVNSNAFFGAFERTTGVNVAAAYAAHICRVTKG